MKIETFKVKNNEFIVNNNILVTTVNNKTVSFTPAEFAMIHYLLHHQSKLISKREFEDKVLHLRFDRNGDITNGRYSTYSHIASIRRKLNQVKEGLGEEIIVTRRALGWYLDNDCQYQH